MKKILVLAALVLGSCGDVPTVNTAPYRIDRGGSHSVYAKSVAVTSAGVVTYVTPMGHTGILMANRFRIEIVKR